MNNENKSLNQNNVTNASSLNRETKKESLMSVPLANNIGDENSFFNSIIHMLYFTPEILIFLEENKQNFKNDYEILLELYKILDKYDKLLDKNQCYLIPEEERFVDIKNLRIKISELYKGEGLFQLGNSDEPSEILYFFLNAFHSYAIDLNSPKYYILENHSNINHNIDINDEKDSIISQEIEEKKEDICDPICLSHSLFDMHLLQQVECLNCKKVGNVKKFPNKFFILDINYKYISINTKNIDKFKYLSNIFSVKLKSNFNLLMSNVLINVVHKN